MKKFFIFASINNIYTGQVKKLKEESPIETQIVYIEDYVEKSENYSFNKEDVIYFLCCNSELIRDAINLLKQFGCYIINESYLENDYKKYDIQELLAKNKVPVPIINRENSIENIKFPIFCKENRHEGIIFQAYNKITLKKFFEKFNIQDFYFENVIVGNGNVGQEEKYYYVAGETFGKSDAKIVMKEVKKVCGDISKALNNLEVFSADMIQTKENDNYVIDVNPSAGFYLSDKGRNCFLNKVNNEFGGKYAD